VNGNIYELSADLVPTGGTSDGWIALGFVATNCCGLISSDGVAWALKKNSTSSPPYEVFSLDGTGSAGGGVGGAIVSYGNYDSLSASPTPVKIVLDTTNPTNWSAQWYLNGDLVRTHAYGIALTDIAYVTLSSQGDVSGSAANFLLTVVPEPGSLGLLTLGLAAICRWPGRRR
jgi:hypothetical protein